MQRRQITLEDGRYLIFYTFEEDAAATASPASEEAADDEKASTHDAEPDAESQATEEQQRV